MASRYFFAAAIALCSLAIVASIPKAPLAAEQETKQLFGGIQGKETSTSDFIRLVVMRLVYGIASTMGLEERLGEMFNGAFVPPGEEEGDYGLEFDGSEDLDGIEGIEGIFEER